MQTATEEAGYEDMGASIMKKKNTVAQYISMRIIMELYEETVQRPGTWFDRRWWDQVGLDLAVARATSAAAADGEGRS